ncbi:MAG TPA: 30S ribosomal protein S15 [Candidatus Peregrinibacteria bacterium]|nr:30S ribosomal protein S15 [Candidatus Peregrinibacteria bacterium]
MAKEDAKKKKTKATKVAKKVTKVAPRGKNKKKTIKKYSRHEKDTGSPEVQIAILSEKIKDLAKHLETHPKDEHSRRGLILMVGRRRKHLNYLSRKDKEKYQEVIDKLKLRK